MYMYMCIYVMYSYSCVLSCICSCWSYDSTWSACHLHIQTCQALALLNEHSWVREKGRIQTWGTSWDIRPNLCGQHLSHDRCQHVLILCLVIYLTLNTVPPTYSETDNVHNGATHILNNRAVRDCVTRAQKQHQAGPHAYMCFITFVVPSVSSLRTPDKHCLYTTTRISYVIGARRPGVARASLHVWWLLGAGGFSCVKLRACCIQARNCFELYK